MIGNGDCLVPQRWIHDPSLGIWVSNQRRLYSKGLLNQHRQVMLEQLDFCWNVRVPTSTRADGSHYSEVLEQKWNHRYGALLAYRLEHGHCNVPQKYETDKSLGHWVAAQRRHQRNGTLREDRKKRLEEIGVPWSVERTKKTH